MVCSEGMLYLKCMLGDIQLTGSASLLWLWRVNREWILPFSLWFYILPDGFLFLWFLSHNFHIQSLISIVTVYNLVITCRTGICVEFHFQYQINTNCSWSSDDRNRIIEIMSNSFLYSLKQQLEWFSYIF